MQRGHMHLFLLGKLAALDAKCEVTDNIFVMKLLNFNLMN